MEELKDSCLLYEKNLPLFGYMIIIAIGILLFSVVIWSIKAPKVYIMKASGTVESINKNYVMAPYTGEITDINIEEGKTVEKGDALFTIKSTDLDLQSEQLESQKEIYETQVEQYAKLVKSIKDDTNYFDETKEEDSLYYSQYEAYQSQVEQQKVDTSMYSAYGYSEEQIEQLLIDNQSKVTEIYYSAIKSAEDSKKEAQAQLDSLEAQLGSVGTGQDDYVVTANASGKIHMISGYKEGMVVQAASAVASIAAEGDEYLVQAYVSPSDAARIEVGDSVDIAVSGLVQGVYGTISGIVEEKDSDITVSQSDSGESSSYFKVKIKPDTTYLVSKEGDKVNISNGMAVETRIQYDKVTYFQYVLEELGVLTR